MRGNATFLQSFGGAFGVRRGREKVPAHAEEESNFFLVHLLDRLDCVTAMLAWRSELKFAAELIEKRIAHPFPNSHRPVALNVRMTAHRTWACAGPADVAAEQ